MSVTQVHEALGSFEFELVGNVPREIIDTIQYFGHIAIIPGRMDPKQYGDNTLSVSRYVGVVRRKKIADDGRTNLIQDDIRVGGVGMEFWLGDEDGKGEVIENETLFNSATFTSAINTLRPDSLDAGTIGTVLGSYSGRHQYETPRTAIQYVCQTMSTDAIPVGYKVTNDGKLNAGPESDLYVISPTCIIVKKGISQGEDMFIRSLRATMDQDYDMEDFTTRVVMIAEASEEQLATGSADIGTVAPGVNVYKDLNGNALQLTRLVSESDTIESNADTRAELNLRNYLDPHRALTIAADDYDIHGSFEVGDYVWVYDPDGGLVDLANEVYFRGIRINPMKLRVTETNWPLTEGYTIAFRDVNGNWTDLTDYIHWEEEQPAQITIGDFTRSLTNDGETVAARVGSFVQPDASIPAAPTWTTGSFTTANYLDGNGFSKAAITVVWSTPINQDGSSITDGDHYEINYRIQGQTDWSVLNVAWGTNILRVADLAVATSYEFRVRGIDRSNNLGTFSSTTTVLASSDSSAPSTPAAPTVAASTIAIQVTHLLGKSSGGNFNLESDLAALEVHMSTSTGFTASSGTYVGSMRANKGMITGSIPAVETFQVGSTAAMFVKVIAVDTSGNKSAASSQATTTAVLVDSAHISDLTATKITAGTLSANILLGASVRTASSGARVELNQNGLQAYASGGSQTVNIDAATGAVTIQGELLSGTTGRRIVVNPTGASFPEIRFYPATGSDYASIFGHIYTDDQWPGIEDTEVFLLMRTSSWVGIDGVLKKSRVYLTPVSATIGLSSTATDAPAGGNLTCFETSINLNVQSSAGFEYGSVTIFTNSVGIGHNRGQTGESALVFTNNTIDVYGKMNDPYRLVGQAVVSPAPNAWTTQAFVGLGLPSGETYRAIATINTTVMGTTVQPGLAVSAVTNNQVAFTWYRTNNTDTNIHFILERAQ